MANQVSTLMKSPKAKMENWRLTYAGAGPEGTTITLPMQSATYAEVGWQAGKRSARQKDRGQRYAIANGDCICQRCGERVPHKRGVPCRAIKCPNCGVTMIRELVDEHGSA